MIDVQSSGITSRFAIESVGITGLEYPLLARDSASGEAQATVARWRLGVTLAAEERGTHMSRFIALLDAQHGRPHGLDEHFAFSEEVTRVLVAPEAQIEAEFPWFRRVAAPVSGRTALLGGHVIYAARTGAEASKSLSVKISAKALCPCSKAISDRGAHNQRSDLQLTVHLDPAAPVPAISTLLTILESSASSPVYPLLKREDEKYVTEAAYDNAVFVEDIVRGAAEKAVLLPNLRGFEAYAINRESIHAHDCYARIVHRG